MNQIMFKYSFLLVGFFCCCAQEQGDVTSTKRHFYSGGQLRKIQEYDTNGVENGLYLYYYDNGILEDSGRKVNGNFHGFRMMYDSLGNFSKKFLYNNGTYRNGVFYKDGGRLDDYYVYNYFGTPTGKVLYDSLGRIAEVNGNIIHTWFFKKQYPVGSTIDLEFLVMDPPNAEIDFHIGKLDDDDGEIVDLQEFNPNKFNAVRYNTLQDSTDTITLLVIAQLRSIENKKGWDDTLKLDIFPDGQTSWERL